MGAEAAHSYGHTIEISSHQLEEVSPLFSGLHGDRDRGFGSRHRTVQRIPFNGFATGLANQADQFLAPHALRCRGPSIVVDLFFDNCTVNVVRAESQ